MVSPTPVIYIWLFLSYISVLPLGFSIAVALFLMLPFRVILCRGSLAEDFDSEFSAFGPVGNQKPNKPEKPEKAEKPEKTEKPAKKVREPCVFTGITCFGKEKS